MRASRTITLNTLAVLFVSSAATAHLAGQNPAVPCCEIASVNANGLVTAQEIKTGSRFQFRVADKAVLAGLHVGQQVWADFAKQAVALAAGATPCCDITGPVAMPTEHGAIPCCSIASIDPTGVVTAHEIATGQVFQFRVADKAVLAGLHVGQQVWADFAKQAVALAAGGTPCCAITGPVAMPTEHGATPCCSITSIDPTGVVTAHEIATGRAFQFQVADKAVLAGLHVGRQVWADFARQAVALAAGGAPCCEITGPVAMPTLHGAAPCCNITSIDPTGVVTAHEIATGRVFQFQVADKAVLAGLHVGQQVWADFAKQAVALAAGGQPCCEIAGPVASGAVDGANATPCCNVAVNATLKGQLGRLLVAFPQGANVGRTRVEVFKAGSKGIQGGYGSQAWELLPGTYAVSISGKRLEGVTVEAGHDTRVRVGILRVSARGNTRIELLDTDKKTGLHGGYGATAVGLPPGTFYVRIAGQLEAVTIREGQITDF